MNRFYLILILIVSNLQAQAIRKNHLEMTETEKVNLVNAFYQLRTGADLMNDLATFHANFFQFNNTLDPTGLAIHLNLPDRPENDIFLAWHRRQIFELERAMQDINPNISIAYWDTSTDQSVNSQLWDQNFLGQFNSDWGLNRTLSINGPLPTPQQVIDVQSNTNYLDYSNELERQAPHVGAHQWVGGAMLSGLSPSDPVFYFHHSNVDRWWAEWQEVNQSTSFIRTSMLRYDGTYVFDGQTLPSVNPNDIVDPKFYGTFYAENQLAELDNYTVSNTFNSLENFYYQFTIQAGNNFIVPTGTNCKFESVNEIVLQPGFEAASGSNFIATIDNTSNRASLSKRGDEIVRNQIPYNYSGELIDLYNQFDLEDTEASVLSSFPNPFSNEITVRLSKKVKESRIVIFDLMGRAVKNEVYKNIGTIKINNLIVLSSGIYILNVLDENDKILLSKKFVKI